MIGGRSALLAAAGGGNPYGNWTGNYSDVSLLLRNGTPSGLLIPLDESPTPKAITPTGNASTSTTVFKYGTSSMVFDGSDSNFSSPHDVAFNIANGDFTIEMWIRQNTQVDQVALSYNGGISTGYRIDLASGRPIWYINSSNAISSTTVLTLNEWQHLAVCRSGSTTRMFLDGTQVGSTTAVFSDPTGTPPLYIGALALPDFYFPLNGYIDDLRITKGVARYTSDFSSSLPAELPANATGDPHYSNVSLLLRNETIGTLPIPLDESPTPKAITPTGNASTSTTVFKYGTSSMVFDGSDSNFSSPHDVAFNIANGDFTIEMWIRQNTQVDQVALSYNGGISTGYRIDLASGRPIWYINSSNAISSTTVLTLNEWQHLAVCRSGSTTRMFLDGTQVGSTTAVFSDPPSGAPLRIGVLREPYSIFQFPFNGYIDDLRITKGVARYTKNFLPPPAELPAI